MNVFSSITKIYWKEEFNQRNIIKTIIVCQPVTGIESMVLLI